MLYWIFGAALFVVVLVVGGVMWEMREADRRESGVMTHIGLVLVTQMR